MAIKFPDSDGFGNPGTPELSFENDIALEFTTDSASYSEYGDADHVSYTQTKRPFKLSQYFRNGNEVPDAGPNSNIPLIGDFPTAISFSDFYGAVNEITVEFIANQYIINGTTYTADKSTALNMYNIASLAITPTNDTITVPFVFKFDSDTVFNNSIQMGGDFSQLTIENDGIIAGRGGDGASDIKLTPDPGNSAIILDGDATLVEIENTTNGIIAGGGNGGARDTSGSGSASRYKTSEDHRPRVEWTISEGGGGGWNGGIGGRTFVFGRAYVVDEDGPDTVIDDDANSDFEDANQTRVVVLNRSGGAGNSNSTIVDTGLLQAGSFSVLDNSLGVPSSGTPGTGTWGGDQGTGNKLHMFSAYAQFNGARIRVRGRAASNGGATLPPDLDGRATGPGGGNSVEKTGTISTLTYIGSTTAYYGTRDT